MRILITSNGDTLDATVDPRFGRAAKFIIVDTETDAMEVHDNAQNLNAPQGAGIQSGQNAQQLGAEWVLTGHCGPKAFQVLQAAKIHIACGVSGTVKEAIERFKAGEFKSNDSADVEGHWV